MREAAESCFAGEETFGEDVGAAEPFASSPFVDPAASYYGGGIDADGLDDADAYGGGYGCGYGEREVHAPSYQQCQWASY